VEEEVAKGRGNPWAPDVFIFTGSAKYKNAGRWMLRKRFQKVCTVTERVSMTSEASVSSGSRIHGTSSKNGRPWLDCGANSTLLVDVIEIVY
jgi:hypothetical protein